MKLTEEVWVEIQELYDDPRLIEILGNFYAYKTIDREEYREALSYSMGNLEKLEDYLIDIALIYPVSINKETSYGGLLTTLSDSILESSGLRVDQIKAVRAHYEQELESIDFQMDLVIKEVFIEYSLDEIEQWSMEEVIRMYTKAKWILENLRDIKINEGTTAQEEAPEQEPKEAKSYQNTFNTTPKPMIEPQLNDFSEKKPVPKAATSEEEMLQMFGQSKNNLTSVGERLPESAWTNHEDELRGTTY